MNQKDSLASASSLLAGLDDAFHAAVAKLASLCAVNGKLDSARLDAHQWASYELALSAADLLAARTLLGVGSSDE